MSAPGLAEGVTTVRSRRVREFHALMDNPIRETPTIPPDEEVRFRLRFLAEEFCETLDAALYAPRDVDALRTFLARVIDDSEIDVELPEFIDGLADLDYVIEGTRLHFGVNGEPIEREVHRANMTKGAGPRRADGKRLKPAGFKPPDVAGELRRQGWREKEGT